MRKEYKEGPKQTREEHGLLSNKDQEDIEAHQVMMEYYFVKVFKISIKEPTTEIENKEALQMDLTMEETIVTSQDNLEDDNNWLVLEEKNYRKEIFHILRYVLEWLFIFNNDECSQAKK